MKRTKVDKLRKSLQSISQLVMTLMESLVKAGTPYGIEIWGWRRREAKKDAGEVCKNSIGGSS